MAIIDSKVDEDAQRQAREYAARNDTAGALDWQQPPPAYEEASSSFSSSSATAATPATVSSSSRPSQSPSNRTEVGIHPQERPSRSSRRTSQREMLRTDSDASDESLPLLTTRQRQRIKRKLRFTKMFCRHIRSLGIILIFLLVILFVLRKFGLLKRDDKMPETPRSDGSVIGSPDWSTPTLRKPDLWPKPYVPLYSSEASFTFSAFDEFFLHATGGDSRYSGRVAIVNIAALTEEELIKRAGGDMIDEVFVKIEAQFTEISLRDSLRINKMQMNAHKKGVGIYGSSARHLPKDDSFMAINVEILVPHGRKRSSAGLAKDNSSFLPELGFILDNMRLSVEGMHNPAFSKDQFDHVTVGRMKSVQLNGGADFVSGFVANESFSISTQNGQVRDILRTPVATIISPSIAISIVNGPIWLNKLIARDSISLKTINGGINITDVAIAKSIKVKHDDGILGGTYRTKDLELSSERGGIVVDVDLRSDLFEGEDIFLLQQEELPRSAGRDNGVRCRDVRAVIRNEVGEIFVNYRNQEKGVKLNSSIITTLGSIVIKHDSGFEGTFDARSDLGLINIQKPRLTFPTRPMGLHSFVSSQEDGITPSQITARERKQKVKQFVVQTKDRGPYGNKETVGRTWWSDHAWEDRTNFCKSTSSIKSGLGSLFLEF
ncbi:hypothetical protein CBS101457_006621 [Exobasidium rhododendri]|nr:hypothetical protein CBS101457_006621 [Exobasidium rhododendri]